MKGIRRIATIIFNTIVWIACIVFLVLMLKCICSEETVPHEAEQIEQPSAVVTASDSTPKMDVVVYECIVIEKADTAQSEHSEPIQINSLYDVPLEADLQRFIIDKAESIGIDPAVVFAMAHKESTYNPSAIGDNGNSLGLLQVQPRWHTERMERLGCSDLLDPFQNVTVAVDLLSELMDKHGDIAVALTVYNLGHYSGYVTDYATTVLSTADSLELVGDSEVEER